MRSTDADDESSGDASGSPDPGYSLLDAGDGRRLERFGSLTIDRPAAGATAPRRAPARWRDVDLRFDPERGWSGRTTPGEPWTARVADLTMELRTTSSGGVGLYPEHAANLAWLEGRVRSQAAAAPTSVLNLFAHTGLATLALARAGASVAHVDGARTAVAWARRNAERNGLAERPIRWLVDDAQAFSEREARRGRRYDGIVLDPPSAGHAGSRRWAIRDDLPRLLSACAVAATAEAFVLLTAHTTGLTGDDLAVAVRTAWPTRRRGPTVTPLVLRAESGATLEAGWAIRLGSPSDAAPGQNAAP